MLAKDKVENILKLYNQMFREEEDTAILSKFLVENDELYNRKNSNGHITSSAFLLNKDVSHILLLFHEILYQWFQPGGHVEVEDENILSGSRRELTEETDFDDFIEIVVENEVNLPIDIDSHWIPPNPKKGEDGHYHHDFRYLFKLKHDLEIKKYNEDNDKFRWVDLCDFIQIDSFAKSGKKIKELLDLKLQIRDID